MAYEQVIVFPPFRLDPHGARLWRGPELVLLRPKTFAVLCYLVGRATRLVTRAELLEAVWPNTHGAEGLPKECIHELREVLGDDAAAPRFIETVGRRQGYRFIAPVTTSVQPVAARGLGIEPPSPPIESLPRPPRAPLVGRVAELKRLEDIFKGAIEGDRKLVFITGEPGIGKTTLVDAFTSGMLVAAGDIWVGHGQCVEHYAQGEAYAPVLEAFGRSCRGKDGDRLIACLDRHAPTWLVQMPALVSAGELEILQRRVQGGTRERMLREMAEAVEALTADKPLVLVLEDLHWSDYSTLDLLSTLGQRRQAARLLLVATYRPAEVVVSNHPVRAVKQELQAHQRCEEVQLGSLTAAEVNHYLEIRFVRHGLSSDLGVAIHEITEGNPLYVVNVVDYLVAQGAISEDDGTWRLRARIEDVVKTVPDNLRELIEKQIDRLDESERQLLTVASVAGDEFLAMTVAAAIGATPGEMEERCEALARRQQFLRGLDAHSFPGGMTTGRYAFGHALYQRVLYDRLTAVQQKRFHLSIAEYEEQLHGSGAAAFAAGLAVHFARAGDSRRAAKYLALAAQNAMQRHAPREAIEQAERGLQLIQETPADRDRIQSELMLQTTLGGALAVTKGFSAPDVGAAYAHARDLCEQAEGSPALFPVLQGLYRVCIVRAQFSAGRKLEKQLISAARKLRDPAYMTIIYEFTGIGRLWIGKFALARTHMEKCLTYSKQKSRAGADVVYDSRVSCLSQLAWVLWLLGYPEQGLKRANEGIALAAELAHPHSLAYTLTFAAGFHHLRREPHLAQERAERGAAHCIEHEIPLWGAYETALLGAAHVQPGLEESGTSFMLQGLAVLRMIGAELARTFLLALLAERQWKLGKREAAEAALAEAFACMKDNGEYFWEAELHRLKGQMLLPKSVDKRKTRSDLRTKSKARPAVDNQAGVAEARLEADAVECFEKAIEVARRQSAKSLELRASVSLSRIWQRQGKARKARQRLAKIVEWFREGLDTPDLKAARELLDDL